MKINIEVIPHELQRYPTAGDWWTDAAGTLQIRASKMSDPRYSCLVILHELIEVFVESMKQGSLLPPEDLIATTDAFDQNYEDKRDPDDFNSEPGYDSSCPVYQGHMIASATEHLAAMVLAVDYNAYQTAITDL